MGLLNQTCLYEILLVSEILGGELIIEINNCYNLLLVNDVLLNLANVFGILKLHLMVKSSGTGLCHRRKVWVSLLYSVFHLN